MCPVCAEPMVSFELEGVEIDRCLGCGGTWLDAGELEQIAGGAGGRLGEALRGGLGERHGSRRCVRCRANLFLVRVSGVELDRCPHGHGLWLDRGEMETLIRSSSEGEEGAVSRFFGDLLQADRPRVEGKGGPV